MRNFRNYYNRSKKSLYFEVLISVLLSFKVCVSLQHRISFTNRWSNKASKSNVRTISSQLRQLSIKQLSKLTRIRRVCVQQQSSRQHKYVVVLSIICRTHQMKKHNSNRDKCWNTRSQNTREANAFHASLIREKLIVCFSKTIKILRRKAHLKNLRDWRQNVFMRQEHQINSIIKKARLQILQVVQNKYVRK
jgi:uncharacterized SAM-binding protein YcdF (DUF218 family)